MTTDVWSDLVQCFENSPPNSCSTSDSIRYAVAFVYFCPTFLSKVNASGRPSACGPAAAKFPRPDMNEIERTNNQTIPIVDCRDTDFASCRLTWRAKYLS